MKPYVFLLFLNVFIWPLWVQAQNSPSKSDSIAVYFHEIKNATHQYEALWGKNLYGPILLVNPETRRIVANEPDTAGVLKQSGTVYVGHLPNEINIANTAINWGGKRWAMIRLPLPDDLYKRIGLIVHELFHKAQPSLGFNIGNTQNNHLNREAGRIYLRLEMEALKKALYAPTEADRHNHLTSALTFRKYRHKLFPGSGDTENGLELNEGLAQYTGLIISGRDQKQATAFLTDFINRFLGFPTYVRSFANFTIPAYGYVLYAHHDNFWNRKISQTTNLTDYFIKTFNLKISDNLETGVKNISEQYDGNTIIAEEQAREERIKRLIAEYKYKLIEQPHLEIPLKEKSISFNPSTLLPIEGNGTVYPSIRVADLWGVLTVEKGALMSPDWDKISVSLPIKIEGKKITGDGWRLELAEGYEVEKEEASGNYKLTAEKDTDR